MPTVVTVGGGAQALGFVLGRGDATDVELMVNGILLRPPPVYKGFYAAVAPGFVRTDSLASWLFVDPAAIYAGVGRTVTRVVER